MQTTEETQRIVRYQQHNGQVYYGILENGDIEQLTSDFTDIVNDDLNYDGTSVKYENVTILEPVEPSKLINFGWTYSEHAEETGGEADLDEPFLFFKPPSSMIADQETIMLPSKDLTTQVEMEGEVAIVIGKRGKDITEADALTHVFGYTIFNDVTARDLTQTDPQFTRGKGFDTFGPIGTYIVKGIDPTNLGIVTTLNGDVVQKGNTNQMSLSIPFLISWISQIMTLEPGDVLATGSPAGSRPMKAGDTVVVEVEQIGKLSNGVK
ncbi:fumarylacetoacetate hydrolase family protein [Barrientosiimonas marina]|uniref:Fumarylacetoacetate hydrolase family protein n=1 Tax=Lentibacillus kimchii TaxID=1542911 RepID=A0ABW2UXA7_9BACI